MIALVVDAPKTPFCGLETLMFCWVGVDSFGAGVMVSSANTAV